MKFLASLLSLYIFFLAVQPVLAAIEFSPTVECCSNCCGHDCEKPAPEKKQQDNSCDNTCNPLMSCSSCIGFTFSFQHFSLSPIVQISEQKSFYQLNAVSEIALPVWQPPKIS